IFLFIHLTIPPILYLRGNKCNFDSGVKTLPGSSLLYILPEGMKIIIMNARDMHRSQQLEKNCRKKKIDEEGIKWEKKMKNLINKKKRKNNLRTNKRKWKRIKIKK